MYIQSFLAGPAFSTFSYSTDNVNFTELTSTQFHSFKDLVANVSGALPNGWAMTYIEEMDRIRIAPGSGSLKVRWGSQSLADAFGFSSTDTAFSSSTILGDKAPAAICPILGAHYSNPIPGKKPNLRTFRHGRAQSVSWGSGTRYGVNISASYENADRILSGPLSTGKLRIGEWNATSVYSGSNLSGYLDAFVTNQPTIEVQQGDVENNLELSLVVNAPYTAHDKTEQPKDEFWGQIERGYSLNYYALVEGLPFRFVEKDTGIADSDRTVSETLIIDDSQASTQKVDRYRAISGASGATLGILDPLNELGIFDLPTFEVQIASEVNYNSTTVTLAASSDALPSSGFVFLGTECLKYTGNTGSSGSPANQLTGITRPFGPGYLYGDNTVQKFKTVTNKKKAWSGSVVRLFAQLVDPFGRAVDTTWEGTYSRQVGCYQIKGLPGYDQGLWVLDCEDLIRRLNRPVVAPPTAQISPFDFQDLYDSLQGQGNEASQVIVDNKGATFEAVLGFVSDTGVDSGGTFQIDMNAPGSPPRYSSYAESLQYALNVMNGKLIPDLGSFTVQGSAHMAVQLENFKIEDDGTVVAQVRTAYGLFSGSAPELTGQVIFRPLPNQVAPSWLPTSTVVAQFEIGLDETIIDVVTGFNGQTQDFVVIDQPANNPQALGTFPSSGLALLGSESNEDGQLIKYEERTSLGSRTLLRKITRLEGNPQSTIRKGGEVSAAELVEGNAGVVIATILESSGFLGGAKRGTYDTLGSGFGYGLDSSLFVNDSTTFPDVETSVLGAPAAIPGLRLALTQGHSLNKIFSGILSSFGTALAWVRSGIYLKIGGVGTTTTGGPQSFTITDSDLIAGRAGKIREIASNPNLVKVKQSSSMLGKGGASYTYRIIEDIQARGVKELSIDLFGLDASNFFSIAEQAAARAADGSFAQIAYELTVTGDRDYLAGQLVKLDLSYPGLWDFQNQTTGLTGTGRILEVSRNLTTNKVRLVVLVNGPAKFLPLCPVAFVTGYNPAGPTITVTDASIFESGDPIRIEIPGVNNGSGHSTFQETTIDSISGTDITLDAALTFSPTSYTVATYVQDDNAAINTKQTDHTHIGDGSRYA